MNKTYFSRKKFILLFTVAFATICLNVNNLHSQIPTPRARIISEDWGDELGRRGISTGDINGDGKNDLVLGAPFYDHSGLTNSGRMYIFYSRNFSGNVQVQTADIIIDGVTENGVFCNGGVLTCDIDGDGLFDVMASAAEIDCVVYDPRGNMTFTLCNFYIFFGKTLITNNYFTTNEADVVITGYFDSADWRNSVFGIGGYPVSGDFNNDGYDDIVFKAGHCVEWGEIEDKVYLFYGRNNFEKKYWSILERDVFIYSCFDFSIQPYPITLPKSCKDVNGDNIDDLVIATWVRYNGDSISVACVNFGPFLKDSIVLDQSEVIIKSEMDFRGEYDGFEYLSNGDINNDYIEDIILGRPYFDAQTWTSREGKVYTIYGNKNLSGFILCNSADIILEGTASGYFNGRFGESIACGDLNQDGESDLAVRSAGCSDLGKIFLYKGFSASDTLLYDYDADEIIDECTTQQYLFDEYMTIADITGDCKEELILKAYCAALDNQVILIFNNNLLLSTDEPIEPPKRFSLEQNYPNPFNPTTTIRYQLAVNSKVTLRIYNTLGQEVKTLVNRHETAGIHKIIWDGTDQKGRSVSSGVYIYRIQAGEFVQSRKMMLIR